eukprot:1639914-Alexandrium_andersonii.AAC.1
MCTAYEYGAGTSTTGVRVRRWCRVRRGAWRHAWGASAASARASCSTATGSPKTASSWVKH